MKKTFRRLSQAIAGLAICGLGVFVATDALAQYTTKNIGKGKATSKPHGCNQKNNQFVIDDLTDRCGGISTRAGRGWVRVSYPGLVGSAYSYVTREREDMRESIIWSPTITIPGRYEVWVSYRETPNRAQAANFYVHADGGTNYRFVINQNGWRGAVWAKLGTFQFDARAASATPDSGYVMIRNRGAGSSEAADGAYFRLVEATGPKPDTDADAVPVPGDYDGDGERAMAVYHTLSGNWDINYSSTGQTEKIKFGEAGAVPVPGDYDGDGTTDLAVYYPSTMAWDIRHSIPGTADQIGYVMGIGVAGAIPVPAKYDEDSITDKALYHQATGVWYIENSTGGTLVQRIPDPPEDI